MSKKSLKLLVIINDVLSDLAKKGEMTDRYYNPGDIFDEVHILLLNPDPVAPEAIQKLVGRATLFIHHHLAGLDLFKKSLGWRPFLLTSWKNKAFELVKTIGPDLIRCHGAHLNAWLACQIKQEFGVPYAVSLHINPDEDVRRRSRNWKEWLLANCGLSLEKVGLLGADIVLPVYKPIVPYLHRLGVKNYQVAYNFLNPVFLQKKTNYDLHQPPRMVYVGRIFKEKYPDQILQAMTQIPKLQYTIIGDGEGRESLMQLARDLGLMDRVEFISALPNDELCARLPEFDLFVIHTEYWEISKSVLEALLTGLPVVLNQRIGEPVPELQGDWVRLVKNEAADYQQAITELLTHNEKRQALGEKAFAYSQLNFSPKATEKVFAKIYKSLLKIPETETT